MVFSEKWLKNHPKFLLHFLIHIDVLMLCRKFELILTNNFQVMSILNIQILLYMYMHVYNDILLLDKLKELPKINEYYLMNEFLWNFVFRQKKISIHVHGA